MHLRVIGINFHEIELLNCHTCRDFSRNYLNGSLPPEWGSSRLTNMYVKSALLSIISHAMFGWKECNEYFLLEFTVGVVKGGVKINVRVQIFHDEFSEEYE